MLLSKLQRYILGQLVATPRQQMSKASLLQYYRNRQPRPSSHDMHAAITKSIDRLIQHDLVIGYGRKTAERWFIDTIRLTNHGKQLARQQIFQLSLPFKQR